MAGMRPEAELKGDEQVRPKRDSTLLRAWRRFKSNRRGYVSLWLFTILFVLSLSLIHISEPTRPY